MIRPRYLPPGACFDDPSVSPDRPDPFVNIMSKTYDFSWEREWRVKGRLEFTLGDIYCVILPAEGAEKIRDKLQANKVPCINPSYSPDMIAEEIARFADD